MKRLRFRLLLPLVMAGLQVGLFAASLIFHNEPWVVASPAEVQAGSQPACSGDDCTVSFVPPPEPRLGEILKAAMVVNFPAVFLGVILQVLANLIHVPHVSGEPALIAFGAVFVPPVWYRTGKWVDGQVNGRTFGTPAPSIAMATWKFVARAFAWFTLSLMMVNVLFGHHHLTRFFSAIWILWTGGFLACGLLGDWRTKQSGQHSREG